MHDEDLDLNLRAVSQNETRYCGFGSCDKLEGHDDEHRCRCGSLAGEPNPKCAWHPKLPEPMTPRMLMAYLQSLADEEVVEDRPFFVGGLANQHIVDARIVNGFVVLSTYEEMLEMDCH